MKRYQVVGIGNAIVDVLSNCDDDFLARMGIEKGIMQLIDRDRGEALYAAMADRTEAPGGSVANTLAGLGNLGLTTGFIGRVNDDPLGRFYKAAMEAEGTDFVNPPVAGGDLPTSRSMIFVTPDGERSMNTYLGISGDVSTEDVPLSVAEATDYLFLEGYLFDKDKGKAAFLKAAEACHRGGGKAGIALSDPFCVNRHRDDFRRLLRDQMDYVIGNSHEWEALYQTDLDAALAQAATECPLIVCTRSSQDVVIIRDGVTVTVPVHAVPVVDATGAGDQFAAGFIHGLATGRPMEVAGKMGVICATEVIGHLGARPETDLLAAFRDHGLM
ncbi:adenosine kinase [Paracoccus sp. p4-l81]|uniref:adenosine kinase n=1 Tax=unclassified Paracoccus (in: a-proteobacteria) TaxID=2688777 RepID=UPI0035B9DC97